MTREIEAAPVARLLHPHALLAIQRALPGWSMTDLAAAAAPALGRLTRHVTACPRCRRQGMNGPLCPRALALTADVDRARNRRRGPRPRPRHEIASPASRPGVRVGEALMDPSTPGGERRLKAKYADGTGGQR